MSSLGEQQGLFVSKIGGPMIFTFLNIDNDDRNSLTDLIQENGGHVVEYIDKNKFTVVLTSRAKHTDDQIQFNMKYIHDCVKKNKILALESYRLDKVGFAGCLYSKPLGSSDCIYFDKIQQGKCVHKIAKEQKASVDCSADADADLKKQIEDMRSLIFGKKKMQPKDQPESLEASVEVMQEVDQSFNGESHLEKQTERLTKRA